MQNKRALGPASNHREFVAPPGVRPVWRFLKSRERKLRRSTEVGLLRLRWELRSARNSQPLGKPPKSIFDQLSIKVINLEHRGDRLTAFCKQMEKLGINDWERIPAVDGKKKYVNLKSVFAGSIACTESHIEALASQDPTSPRIAMVCEDDLEFLANRSEIEGVISEFLSNPLLSVLCLSGRPRGASFYLSRRLRVATGIVGRGCYLVKHQAVQPLINAFQAGIPELVLGRVEGKGDRMWGKLQKRGFFFAFPSGPVAQQSAGYSDIEDVMLGPR